MAVDRKGPGGSRDVDDLKARLGLKVPRKVPPAASPGPVVPGPVAPGPVAPAAEAGHDAYSADPTTLSEPGMMSDNGVMFVPGMTSGATAAGSARAGFSEPDVTQPLARTASGEAQRFAPPARFAEDSPTLPPAPARSYTPPLYVEEAPPPPKSLWQRMGRPMLIALVLAAAGGVVGYLFGKGAAIRTGYAQVKADAIKIEGVLKETYGKVDEVAALIDPRYAASLKAGAPPAGQEAVVRAIVRQDVDWASLEALEKLEAPKELESIFETDYKRFNRSTVKTLVGFFIDFTRVWQLIRDHATTTKAARAQLDAEAKQGSGPKVYGIISAGLPTLERGEIVLLRGRRTVKQGTEDVTVVDVAKRGTPTQPIAIPEANVMLLSAPGLIKTSGSLLEEFNRRNRDIAETLRRLLEARPRLKGALEQIISQIKG